jgi:hypothetical protein
MKQAVKTTADALWISYYIAFLKERQGKMITQESQSLRELNLEEE